MEDNKADFRDLMNIVLRGYVSAWDFCKEIPNVDNIIDEIYLIATERLEVLAMEENADNPAFWEEDSDEMETIIGNYISDYCSTGYVELCQSVHLFLNDLRLTYIAYSRDGNATVQSDTEYKVNSAQNFLFDFNTFYAGFASV